MCLGDEYNLNSFWNCGWVLDFWYWKVVFKIIQLNELEPNRCKNGWQPPPNEVIKVNWDASLNKKDGCIGLGIIARYSAGGFLGARSVTQKMMTESKIAEVMVALCAMNFSKDVVLFIIFFMSFFKEIYCKLLEKLTWILPIYPELATLLKSSNMNRNGLDPLVLFIFLESLTQFLGVSLEL
jgi:hypothetical protein